MSNLNKNGDTIIEVILAMAMLSFVLFSSWAITNRASQISLAARQRVVMVNQLKEQAELLKAYYRTVDGKIDIQKRNSSDTSSIPISENPCTDVKNIFNPELNKPGETPNGAHYFMIDSISNKLVIKETTKPVGGDTTQRIWLQREVLNLSNKYVDYYIRGCWAVTGGNQKLDNSQFIVRLNLL